MWVPKASKDAKPTAVATAGDKKPSFAEFQRHRHGQYGQNSAGRDNSSPTSTLTAPEGQLPQYSVASRGGKPGGSAPQQPLRVLRAGMDARDLDVRSEDGGRVKVLWEDTKPADSSKRAAKKSPAERQEQHRSASTGRAASARKTKARDYSGGHRGGSDPRRSWTKESTLPSARELVQQVIEWEKQFKSSPGQEDVPVLSPLAEFDRNAVPMPCVQAFQVGCVDLLTAYPTAGRKIDADRRLWQCWYRRIDRAANDSEAPTGSTDTLDACSVFYTDLVERLEAGLKSGMASSESREAVKYSLQQSLVALGDIERYKQQKLAGTDQDWSTVVEYYQKALTVAPSNGKVYNQLALAASRSRQFLRAAYLYARSLSCENPFPARENLVQSLKMGCDGIPTTLDMTVTLDQETAKKLCVPYILQRMLSVLEGSSLEKWDGQLQPLQPLLAAWIGVPDQQNGSVSATLMEFACVSLYLVYDTQHNTSSQTTTSMPKFSIEYAGVRAKCALNLVYALGTATILKITDLASVLTEYPQALGAINSVLAPLNVFLLWLQSQGWLVAYHAEEAEAFRAACAKFHFMLPSSVLSVMFLGPKSSLNCNNLPEDAELEGFLPLREALVGLGGPISSLQRTIQNSKTTQEDRFGRTVELCKQYITATNPRPASTDAFTTPSAASIDIGRQTTLNHHTVRNKKTAAKLVLPPPLSERLCSQCCNSSMFEGGVCEFCGFEDELDDDTSDDDGDVDIVLASQPLDRVDFGGHRLNGNLRDTDKTQVVANPADHGARSLISSLASTHLSQSPPTSFAAVMSIGSQYQEFQSGLNLPRTGHKCLIVIDGPNVAMRHGMGKKFSSIGVRLAIDYFRALQHRVVAFIPDYMLQDVEEQEARRSQKRLLNPEVSTVPDNVELLRELVQQGVLIPTPPQDYDDSYCIQYAGLHDGCVVTNDLFRDHVENMEGPRERKEAMRVWLKAHQISFTWVQNEFLPNPNFRFPA